MSGKRLEALHDAHGVIPCRQELPPHANIRDADAAEAAEMQIFRNIVPMVESATSWPERLPSWIHRAHTQDLHGFERAEGRRCVLGLVLHSPRILRAVLTNRPSSIQKVCRRLRGRTNKVMRSACALRDSNAWYSSSGIVKLVQSIPAWRLVDRCRSSNRVDVPSQRGHVGQDAGAPEGRGDSLFPWFVCR